MVNSTRVCIPQPWLCAPEHSVCECSILHTYVNESFVDFGCSVVVVGSNGGGEKVVVGSNGGSSFRFLSSRIGANVMRHIYTYI